LYDPRVRVVVAAGAVVIAAAGLGGCRQLFGLDDTHVDTADAAGGTDAVAGNDAASRRIAHLRAEDVGVLAFDGDLVVATETVLDTDALTIEPATAAVGIRVFAQDAPGGAPEVVVVDASTITITSTFRIRGSRPAILAATTITLGGTIDASADATTAFAGGYAAEDGPGAGGRASPSGTFDPGAGGAGYGTPGAAGADNNDGVAGQGGGAYGVASLDVLEGGSGGGSVSRCPNQQRGGAGGGAIQLTAFDTLELYGIVDAGGGGGSGGELCNQTTEGAGGGSGGAIYLQAAQLLGNGTVAANGGGGGSAAGAFIAEGLPGTDGLAGTAPAPGGASTGEGAGGLGGSIEDEPTRGTMQTGDLNGGGGGGAVGRIVVRFAGPPPEDIVFSPAPSFVPP
jgi:hypothetical protein